MITAATSGPSRIPTAPRRWRGPLRWITGGMVTLIAGAALLLAWWLPDETALAQQAERTLQDALGVPVHIDALRWKLLPYPSVALLGVTIAAPEPRRASQSIPADRAPPSSAQTGPITVMRLTVVPELSLAALQTRSFRVRRAEVDGAVLPQRTLTQIAQRADTDGGFGAAGSETDPVLAALVWQRVTWVPRHGNAFTLAGEATFDAQWRPRHAVLRWPDAAAATDITLERIDSDDRWTVQSHAGGGTVDGELQLQDTDTHRVLSGTLASRDVEVASALAALNRRAVVRGKVAGRTTVGGRSGVGEGLGALVRSLQTDTRFTMGASTLLRFDLAKAVRSAGTDTRGETPLESITGQMTTQNTGNGMVTRFRGIQARSGALSAVGDATLANRQIDAELAVDLVDGLVGVPLVLSGPVTAIKVSLAPSALAGAAVGTAVLPSVGTALGARLGAAIGRMLGGPAKPSPPTPVR